MVERRRDKRYGLICKVVYSSAKMAYRKIKAFTNDISLGGIGLNLNRPLKQNTSLYLKIYPPYSKKPVEATGKVVWQKSKQGDVITMRAGIEFTDIGWNKIKKLIGAYA